MDADLVGAAGVEIAADEGGGAEPGEDFVTCAGSFPGAGGIGKNGHLLAVVGGTADDIGDGAGWFFRDAGGDAKIGLGIGALGELSGEVLVGLVVAGDDHAAAGIFIEPVDDAGAVHPADGGEWAEVVEKSVYEGAICIARCGVDDHAVGFVDNREVSVLVEDRERDVLGEGFGRGIGRDFDGDFRPFGNGRLGFGCFAVEADVARFYERLETGAGELGEMGGQDVVEPLAGIGGRSGEGGGRVGSFVGHRSV